MFKLRYRITETRYIITGFINKIIDPFLYCANAIPRFHINHKLKVIIIMISISLLVYGIYGSISYYTLDQPLYCAAADNDLYQAKRLLKEGADPNHATWEDGSTALQEAKKYEYKDMVKLLIKYGAKH